MTATVTTRVAKEVLRQIDEFSADKNMDRSTMLRNLIVQGLEEEKRKKVLSEAQRKISLQKAASCFIIGIALTEVLELLEKEELHLDYTEEDRRRA